MDWLMWFVYAVDVLSEADAIFGVITIISLILWVVSSLIYVVISMDNDDETQGFLAITRKLFWTGVIAAALSVVIPATTTMYTMLAIKAVDVVAETEAVQTLVPKSVEVIETYLEDVIDDLREKGQEATTEQLEGILDKK